MSDEELCDRANAVLMRRQNLTEPEAHRLLFNQPIE